MKLQFSDTTNKIGIVQVLERMTKTQSATASSYPLLDKTVDINSALGHFMLLANKATGRWQVDDTNHSDYPIVFGSIVSGQQDYSFTVDEQGNQITDIWKVRAKMSDGTWKTLIQRDLQDGDDTPINSTQTGNPSKYDLTANGIFLTDIPNYNSTNGLEIFTSRSPSYFIYTDTTKVAGIPEMFHEYLALRPAYFYCAKNQLPMAKDYKIQLYGEDGKSGLEGMIMSFYSKRNRDERPRMSVKQESNK